MILETLARYPHSSHYLRRYVKFIDDCLAHNESSTENLESHHICPKAQNLFPEYKSFKANPWNCARLTYRQHYIAHLILSKMYTSTRQRASVLKALYSMHRSSKFTGYRTITSRMVDSAKLAASEAMKIDNPMQNSDVRTKARHKWQVFLQSEKGKKFREERSKSRMGVNNLTEDGLRRLSERWTGVPRPKTDQHIENHKRSLSKGIVRTPFGDFWSITDALKSNDRPAKLSRKALTKYLDTPDTGYQFIPKTEIENWKSYSPSKNLSV